MANRCAVCANFTTYCSCPKPAPAEEPTTARAAPVDGFNGEWKDFTFLAEWVESDYQWSAIALVRHNTTGALFLVRDSGCSCCYAWEQHPNPDMHNPEAVANDNDGWQAIVAYSDVIDPDDQRTDFLRTAAMALRDGWVLEDGSSRPR